MKKVTLPPMTILLVDDHDDTRDALKDWFERDNHKVFDAPDKKTALALGREHNFDVLICDLQLTDGDGCELMQALRAEKSVVGIAVSGHCAPADLARSKAAGFLSHLVKPIPPDEIDAALAAARKELTRAANSKPKRTAN